MIEVGIADCMCLGTSAEHMPKQVHLKWLEVKIYNNLQGDYAKAVRPKLAILHHITGAAPGEYGRANLNALCGNAACFIQPGIHTSR